MFDATEKYLTINMENLGTQGLPRGGNKTPRFGHVRSIRWLPRYSDGESVTAGEKRDKRRANGRFRLEHIDVQIGLLS